MYLNKLLLTAITSLILTSCGPDEYSQETLQSLGTKAATSYITSNVQESYLACYALHTETKAKCVNILHDKYILNKWRTKEAYIINFQYQAEKLGFKSFLNKRNLPCDVLASGPQFNVDKLAYEVKCLPENTYFMQFDYETKEWSVKQASS